LQEKQQLNAKAQRGKDKAAKKSTSKRELPPFASFLAFLGVFALIF
jgi:hypothetical protein